jgi:Ca2+-binding EF-hand superfamily protein
MKSGLSDEKLKEYKESFEMFDRDKNGQINAKELGNILRSLSHEPTESDLNALIEEHDGDRDGKIEFNEFLQIILKYAKDTDIEDELIEAFKVFDKEGNGLIPSSEFKHIMLTLGERLSDDEVDEMIKEADYRGEGFINYKEFVKILLSR